MTSFSRKFKVLVSGALIAFFVNFADEEVKHMTLQSREFNYGAMTNDELRSKVGKLKREVEEEKKEMAHLKYRQWLKIDMHHRARMDREICVYLLVMAKKSESKETRREGRKLLEVIKNL